MFAFVFWLLLVGSLDPQELVAGILVATAVAALSSGRQPILAGIRLRAGAPTAFIRLSGFAAGRPVACQPRHGASRAVACALPIRPALVRINTSLRSGSGASGAGQQHHPDAGTLTVDVEDDALLVHWIDCPPGTDIATATQTIASGFERHLGVPAEHQEWGDHCPGASRRRLRPGDAAPVDRPRAPTGSLPPTPFR